MKGDKYMPLDPAITAQLIEILNSPEVQKELADHCQGCPEVEACDMVAGLKTLMDLEGFDPETPPLTEGDFLILGRAWQVVMEQHLGPMAPMVLTAEVGEFLFQITGLAAYLGSLRTLEVLQAKGLLKDVTG